jgi:uncharacterized membrane protein YfcA
MLDLIFPTVFETPLQLLAVAAVLLVAQVVYVVFGFGAGLIAIGTLALILPDMRDAVVLLLLVNLPAELAVVTRSWQMITWRKAGLLLVGVFAGIPLGTYALKAGSPAVVLSMLGVFLVVVGGVFLALPEEAKVRWPAWSNPPIGLVAGVLSGLFGTPGPPLIIYYHLSGLGRSAFRGNLMALFLATTLVRVPTYVVGGLVTPERLWSGVILLPVAVAGGLVGNRIHLNLSEGSFRSFVSILLAAMGLLLILRQFG